MHPFDRMLDRVPKPIQTISIVFAVIALVTLLAASLAIEYVYNNIISGDM